MGRIGGEAPQAGNESENESMSDPDAGGSLLSIWTKQGPGQPMLPQDGGELVAGSGLAGSAPTKGKRQVTVLSREAWRLAAEEAGQPEADPALRRANLLVTGVDLKESAGRTLRIGPTRIRIHGETKPCQRMDAAAMSLRETLAPDWRGGAFGEVVEGGAVRIGDEVGWAS